MYECRKVWRGTSLSHFIQRVIWAKSHSTHRHKYSISVDSSSSVFEMPRGGGRDGIPTALGSQVGILKPQDIILLINTQQLLWMLSMPPGHFGQVMQSTLQVACK